MSVLVSGAQRVPPLHGVAAAQPPTAFRRDVHQLTDEWMGIMRHGVPVAPPAPFMNLNAVLAAAASPRPPAIPPQAFSLPPPRLPQPQPAIPPLVSSPVVPPESPQTTISEAAAPTPPDFDRRCHLFLHPPQTEQPRTAKRVPAGNYPEKVDLILVSVKACSERVVDDGTAADDIIQYCLTDLRTQAVIDFSTFAPSRALAGSGGLPERYSGGVYMHSEDGRALPVWREASSGAACLVRSLAADEGAPKKILVGYRVAEVVRNVIRLAGADAASRLEEHVAGIVDLDWVLPDYLDAVRYVHSLGCEQFDRAAGLLNSFI